MKVRAEVRERLKMHDIMRDREVEFDGAVAVVLGDDGETYSYTIRLDEDWRRRPEYVQACLETAKQRAIRDAERVAQA